MQKKKKKKEEQQNDNLRYNGAHSSYLYPRFPRSFYEQENVYTQLEERD